MSQECENPNCHVSTGIHDGLTFGSGTLDPYGFWSKPCRICAAFDKRQALVRFEFQQKHPNANIERDHLWLVLPAWPYEEK